MFSKKRSSRGLGPRYRSHLQLTCPQYATPEMGNIADVDKASRFIPSSSRLSPQPSLKEGHQVVAYGQGNHFVGGRVAGEGPGAPSPKSLGFRRRFALETQRNSRDSGDGTLTRRRFVLYS
jgi:hypothetical protein